MIKKSAYFATIVIVLASLTSAQDNKTTQVPSLDKIEIENKTTHKTMTADALTTAHGDGAQLAVCHFKTASGDLPVIFTGNQGTGPSEYQASNNPDHPNAYTLQVDYPPGFSTLAMAWWTPYHNVGAENVFALIDVSPTPDDGQKTAMLSIAGYAGTQNRMRIHLYCLAKK